MRVHLGRLNSTDLLVLAALGGSSVSVAVEAELDRRAAAAVVRHVLKGMPKAGPERPVRFRAKAEVAA
jgi:hypothetical protein